MAYISLEAPEQLSGELWLQGSKNAALPMIAAALISEGITILHNCPDIQDVDEMLDLLRVFGCRCEKVKQGVIIDGSNSAFVCDAAQKISAEKMKKTRASIVLLGALLGRFGEARMPYPGGCKIGERKIDMHLDCLRAFGYTITENDQMEILANGKIKTDIAVTLPFASVGATENAILASVLSNGYLVTLENVAREPEIVELCRLLNKMGAKISGAGSTQIQVNGVRKLHDCEYAIPSDRIVAGTYGAAVLATGGTVSMHGIRPMLDESVRRLFQGFGMEYTEGKDSIFMRFLKKKHWKQQGHFILSTAPYPGFPTDLQSQMMAVMACHVETGIIIENIFENRLQTAEMLNSMGADIQILNNRMALITGVNGLKGCTVEAGDLRGGAALVIAGLMAEGTTRIWGIEYIKRGYEDICRDFSQLGVNIETEI